MNYVGGCICGEIRYSSSESPIEAGYCHCSICRKSTSAPVVAFASFPISFFKYTKGEPSIYLSSSTGSREFCNNCGTQICHRKIKNPKTIDINSGTLDDINLVPPKFHIYSKDKVPWLEIRDQHPRYEKGIE